MVRAARIDADVRAGFEQGGVVAISRIFYRPRAR